MRLLFRSAVVMAVLAAAVSTPARAGPPAEAVTIKAPRAVPAITVAHDTVTLEVARVVRVSVTSIEAPRPASTVVALVSRFVPLIDKPRNRDELIPLSRGLRWPGPDAGAVKGTHLRL